MTTRNLFNNNIPKHYMKVQQDLVLQAINNKNNQILKKVKNSNQIYRCLIEKTNQTHHNNKIAMI
jgi:hypothetical protein